MLKSNLNSIESQTAFGHFVMRLLQATGNTSIAPTPESALALATAALGSDARTLAIVQSLGAALAYVDAELTRNSSILGEEGKATAAANAVILPIQNMRLQALIDLVEADGCGSTACPMKECESKAHSRGRLSRTFTGCHGKMHVTVRHSVCQKPECRHHFSPACDQLRLDNGQFTPGCAAVITRLATVLPHTKSVKLLGDLLQVEVSAHASQDLTEARGATLLELDLAAADAHNPYDNTGLERQTGRPVDAVPAADAPDVAYIEIDGVFPMTREKNVEKSKEVPGARGGKGRRYDMEGREVKNAVFYKASDQAQEMPTRGCILARRYVSYLGNCKVFGRLLWLMALKMRFDQAKLLVVLSDGAEWIRTLAESLPMGNRVLLILDFFHAVHRVGDLARAVYGDGTDLCTQKAKMWKEVIEQGHVSMLIADFKTMHDKRPNVQKIIDELVVYFENNKDRMDYPSYKVRGLRYTSGIVESANFHMTGARLKQQGMRWNEKGAREMAHLRADYCNETWPERTRQLLAA